MLQLKNLILISFIIFGIFSSLVFALKIEINIEEKVDLKVFLNYEKDVKNSPFELNAEVYNIGSEAYSARLMMDIFENGQKVFTVWSKEDDEYPGDKKFFNLYWFEPNASKQIEGRIRIYYGNEMLEKWINFSVENNLNPEDVFSVKNLRTQKNEVKFLLKTNVSLNDVIISFDNYPSTWIFEQTKIRNIEKDKPISVKTYFSGVGSKENVKMLIFTKDGKYYKEIEFSTVNPSFLQELFNSISDFFLLNFGFIWR